MNDKIEVYNIGTSGFYLDIDTLDIYKCIITKIEIKKEIIYEVDLFEFVNRKISIKNEFFSNSVNPLSLKKRNAILSSLKEKLLNTEREVSRLKDEIKKYLNTEKGYEIGDICNRSGCCGIIRCEYTGSRDENDQREYYPECQDCGWEDDETYCEE